MKQYKITIANGNHPLTYTCDTFAQAYDCIHTLASRPVQIKFDRDELPTALLDTCYDRPQSCDPQDNCSYTITVIDEEAE